MLTLTRLTAVSSLCPSPDKQWVCGRMGRDFVTSSWRGCRFMPNTSEAGGWIAKKRNPLGAQGLSPFPGSLLTMLIDTHKIMVDMLTLLTSWTLLHEVHGTCGILLWIIVFWKFYMQRWEIHHTFCHTNRFIVLKRSLDYPSLSYKSKGLILSPGLITGRESAYPKLTSSLLSSVKSVESSHFIFSMLAKFFML